MIRAELDRYFANVRSYYMDYVVETLALSLIYVSLWTASTDVSPSATLYGFLLWYIGFSALHEMGQSTDTESSEGTLEQIALTQCGIKRTLIVRSLVVVLVESLLAVIVGGLCVALSSAMKPGVWVIPGSAMLTLTCTCLTFAGMVGLGLVISGLVLRYKRISGLTHLLQYFLLFFTGIFRPVSELPWLIRVPVMAFPTTWATAALQDPTHSHWAVIGLATCSLAHLAIGLTLFSHLESRAVRAGSLYAQ